MSSRASSALLVRAHPTLDREWCEQGLGWPGRPRFGLRRNPQTNLPEPVPSLLRWVRPLHDWYEEATVRGRGLRAVAFRLKAEGGPKLSVSTIRRILRDPIYVHGEWHMVRRGQAIPRRSVELGDLAVPKSVFVRTQDLLKQRAPRRGT